MEKTKSQILKEYVKEQKFGITREIMDAIKEMFQEVLQQVLVSELWNCQEKRTPKLLVKAVKLAPSVSQRMAPESMNNSPDISWIFKKHSQLRPVFIS